MASRAAASSGRRERPVPPELRRDVRLLTTLLGEAVARHGGPELLARVEELRLACAALSERPSEKARRRCESLVAALSLEKAEKVARAFATYFQLVNVAEERSRTRELRESRRTSVVRPGVELTLVLTAHPTEAKRRAVVEHLWRIGDLLDDAAGAQGADDPEALARLAEEIEGLWLTDPVRMHAPTPLDEVRALMALFDRTLFTTLPKVCRSAAPEGGDAVPRLRWATWVGGDRDGNPHVTAEVTREALAIQREHVLRGYEAASRRIARTLSVGERDVPATGELRRVLRRCTDAFPERAADLKRKLPDAPHRRTLVLVADRIAATREGGPGAYAGPLGFSSDLLAIQRSLTGGGAVRLARGELQGLIWQAETFGFHLASMEIRQHSGALSRPDEELLETFRMMAKTQAEMGEEACRRFIVSFTRGAGDVEAAYEAARLADQSLPHRLDVVPLFESKNELEGAVEIMEEVAALPAVRARLRANGGELEVMVGYSDSAKESGVLAASFLLYRAQRELASWGRRRGLKLTIFHGRGGALGRGGGPTARAIMAQPPGSVDGRFKVTEQGEVAFARYGNPDVARHHLEQLAHATAEAPGHDAPDPADGFQDQIRAMSEASATEYRSLVETPGFASFFAQVTPIRQIASLPLASRPVSRSSTVEDLDSLRAIPWVFAWAQSRVNLAGWYGLGTGLQAVAGTRGGMARLRRMAREWRFFSTILENAELSVAKADREIAARYLERGARPELASRILEELELTESMLARVTGHARPLDGRRGLQATIDLRAPYVDALSFLQLRFLGVKGARAERLVQATVGGVAAGLQNTG